MASARILIFIIVVLFRRVSFPVSAYEVALQVGDIQLSLEFDEGSDLTALARSFVEEHRLAGGEGCTTNECIISMLETMMRQRMGECGLADASAGCVNRVSVSGLVYRAQAAVEVARQTEAFSTQKREVSKSARWVRAPCVSPYCDFECATTEAAVEATFAHEFLSSDEELARLMRHDPEPRLCPGNKRFFPIFIGIPAEDIVKCIPRKFRRVQAGIREHHTGESYSFGPGQEAEYKRAYREAYFGLTKRKAGWDCLRHYEILASGSIPLFQDKLENAPQLTMAHWPKKLLDRLSLDYYTNETTTQNLDADGQYATIAAALRVFLQARLTTEALAAYILRAAGKPNAQRVLLLSAHPDPDYQRDMLIHGLRRRLGTGLVDFVRPAYLYAPAPGTELPPATSTLKHLYGYGFTYAQRLRDHDAYEINRTNIEQRILNHEFDLVIYASVHRGMPFWPAVYKTYEPHERVFVDGEDEHGWCLWSSFLSGAGTFFMRELPDGCPPDVSASRIDNDNFLGPFPD